MARPHPGTDAGSLIFLAKCHVGVRHQQVKSSSPSPFPVVKKLIHVRTNVIHVAHSAQAAHRRRDAAIVQHSSREQAKSRRIRVVNYIGKTSTNMVEYCTPSENNESSSLPQATKQPRGTVRYLKLTSVNRARALVEGTGIRIGYPNRNRNPYPGRRRRRACYSPLAARRQQDSSMCHLLSYPCIPLPCPSDRSNRFSNPQVLPGVARTMLDFAAAVAQVAVFLVYCEVRRANRVVQHSHES